MQNYLVAYDVFDKKRLPKVKKVVYSYALGGQKSALEVPLDHQLIKQLSASLLDLMDKEDKCNFIHIVAKPILLGKAKQLAFENNGVIIL